MTYTTFADLQAELQRLFTAGELTLALQLAEAQMGAFPEYAHMLYYWRSVLAAAQGDAEQTAAVLAEAQARGLWFGETLLRQTPAFSDLQGAAAFEQQVQAHRDLRRADELENFPLLILRQPGRGGPGEDPLPLLLALHDNGAAAKDTLEFWRPAAQAGWLVAAPQSTQAMWRGAYLWDDRRRAESELLRHFGALNEQYAVDPANMILGGHGMGAEIALWLALTQALPAAGFIALAPDGPWTRTIDAWRGLIADYPGGGLRGYIILGEEDTAVQAEAVELLAELLQLDGIAVELEQAVHAAHDDAPLYESALQRALAFLSDEPPLA